MAEHREKFVWHCNPCEYDVCPSHFATGKEFLYEIPGVSVVKNDGVVDNGVHGFTGLQTLPQASMPYVSFGQFDEQMEIEELD